MSRAATARLFIALDIPGGVREELAAWTRRAAGAAGGVRSARSRREGGERRTRRTGTALRAVGIDSLHMTVSFLGYRPLEELRGLEDLIEVGVEPRVSEVSLGAPLWLPPRRPRVLAVEVHDDDAGLQELYREVARGLARAGIEPAEGGRRSFRPHITVARLKRGMVPAERTLPPTPRLSFVPERLVLYRSFLSAEGARYEPLAERETFSLG